jgi:pyruvate-formate lyase-activating enzyme
MELQLFFNIIIGTAGFLGGVLMNRLFSTLDKINDDLKQIPEKYVAKDDYREDIREVKEMLGAIFKRLEGKADK